MLGYDTERKKNGLKFKQSIENGFSRGGLFVQRLSNYAVKCFRDV